jgi:AcrR family transcriptional regulator
VNTSQARRHILQQKGAICRIMKRKYTPTVNLKGYIAESLLFLMRKKGFADISIGEITDKAGVNRSSYYRNFNSKEDVVKYFFNKIVFELMEKIKDRKDIALKNYLEIMFSHFYQYKKELLLIHKNRLSHIILDALNETFSKIEKKQLFEELFRIYYHTGGIYNSFLLWFADDMCQTPERMAELSIDILPKGFKPILL